MKSKISTSLLTITVVSFLLMAAQLPDREISKKQQPPNILLILVDDLKPALGVYGDKLAKTPHMNQLASRGIRFNKAYSNQAVCAPSRYNLMMGSRSTSTGIYGFGKNFRDSFPNTITLPQFFMQQGYHTESMGKVFHIGHNTYNDEASWSVPHHKDLVIEYIDPPSKKDGFTREEALFSNQKAAGLPRGPAWESPDVEDAAYADGRTANRAVKRLNELKNQSDKPFFLAVGFARPHLPFSVPKKYWDLYNPDSLPISPFQQAPKGAPSYAIKRDTEISQYRPIPHSSETDLFPDSLQRKLIHGYYAGVSYVDAQIGKVLAALQQNGLDKNTIVVLWGDHGYHLGEFGIWTKHVNFEAANKIPLIMAGPGISSKGIVTDQLTETVDIYPTLVEMAGFKHTGITAQPFDGISMVPVIRNPMARVRNHAYHCFPRGGRLGRAIRTDRYRMVEWKKIGASAETAEYELYDYQNGETETKNIASENPAVLNQLKKILAQHPEAVNSPAG